MHLINCSTLELEDYIGSKIPPYAILSHTWGNNEVEFIHLPLNTPATRARAGFRKIKLTCEQALRDGIGYAWIDTCCIDKRSSAELSEAINSMFAWYRDAQRCYAYLADVLENSMDEEFRKSRWFTRGWTLQELLAPSDVTFYNCQWDMLGKKSDRAELISEITGIDAKALLETSMIVDGRDNIFGAYCVAKKMSWASQRETTRIEDMAYCLLGIFDINMPLLYGEGNRAFRRLQEEIIHRINDDSILAWGLDLGSADSQVYILDLAAQGHLYQDFQGILASSPKEFVNCGTLEYASRSAIPPTLTSAGLTIQLSLVPVSTLPGRIQKSIGLLRCSIGGTRKFLGILTYKTGDEDVIRGRFPTKTGFCDTVPIGLRDALGAHLETVTMSELFGSSTLNMFQKSSADILVRNSDTLHHLGLQVVNTSAWYSWLGKIIHTKNYMWDSNTMSLTVKEFWIHSSRTVFELCFKSSQFSHPDMFTVFVHIGSSKAVMRNGDTFSPDEKLNFFLSLKQEGPQDFARITCQDREGRIYQVSVMIRAVTVYQREIFELSINAVPVCGDSSELLSEQRDSTS